MRLRGHHVFSAAGETKPADWEQISSLGAIHHDIPLARASLDAIADARAFAALVRLTKTLTPDVVLAYTVKPVIYGSIAARLARVPKIYSMITGLGYSFGRRNGKQLIAGLITRTLYRLALRWNSAIFFHNTDNRKVFFNKQLIRKSTNTAITDGSGVDVERYQSTPLPESPAFLLIARLLWEKGIGEYVAAARMIKQKHPEADFFLVGGSDPNPSSIPKGQIQKWQREGIIKYLGPVDDVRPAIAACSVYVLPSYHEGLPRTVLEAMAMGRPVITTEAAGCRETIRMTDGGGSKRSEIGVTEGENGFLVPPRDARALALAMEEFIRRPELAKRMGRDSRCYAVDRFEVSRVNRTILEAMGL
jgi:glycosyltransferase involved in cell wall biosynthesis